MKIDDAAPFLEAAADAMGIEKLRVIATGLDPVTAEREQWDDGNNTLAVAPGVVVAYERNIETNARLGIRASRCCPSPHRSSAPAAAARAACPAPPPATRCSPREIAFLVATRWFHGPAFTLATGSGVTDPLEDFGLRSSLTTGC